MWCQSLCFVSQVGNCTLGGPQCGCPSEVQCSYSGFVEVVQNASSRAASVAGAVLVRSGIVIASTQPVSQQLPLLAASGSITVNAGSSLVVSLAPVDGTVVLVSSQASLQGRFDSVVATVAQSGSSCVVGTPSYSGTTLSVTLSNCPSSSSLSTGAIVGICVGAAVGGVLLVVGIVAVSKALITQSTAKMKTELKQSELDKIKQQQI